MTIRDIAIAFGYEVNKGTEKAVQKSVDSIKSYANKALGAIGLGFSLVQLNQIVEEYQSINQQVKYATDNAEDQASLQREILDVANSTKQNYAEMATTVTDLMNTHNKLFQTVEGTAKFAELTNKAFKSAGANESEINSLNKAIQTTFTTGKLSAGSFQTMMNACPKTVTYLSETLGISEQQVKALGTSGAITANQLYTAFTANADKINSAFSELPYTVTDALKYIKNEFGLWLVQLNDTYNITQNVAKFMTRAFNIVMDGVKKVTSWTDRLSNRLGGVNNFVKLLAVSAGGIFAVIKGPHILDFLNKAQVALKGINLKTILITGSIMAVALVFEDFIQFLKGNNSVTGQFFESIGLNAGEMREQLLGVLGDCKESLLEAWGTMKDSFAGAWETIKPALKELVNVLINMLTQILPVFCNLLASLAKIFANIAKTVLPVLVQIFTKVVSIIAELIDSLLPVITGLLDRLIPVIEKFIGDILPPLVDFVSRIIELFLGVIQSILPSLISLISEVVPILMDIIEGILPILAALMEELLPLILEIIEAILPVLVDLIQQLMPFIIEMIKTLLPPILDLLKQIIPIITQIVAKLLPVITKLLDALLPILSSFISSILPPILELIQAIVPVILQIVEAILPIIVQLIDMLVPILMQIIDLLMPILELILSLIGPLLTMVIEILKPILSLVISILGPLLELVTAILKPIFEVITALLGPLFQLVTAILEPLIGILKTIFSVVGPFVEILTSLLGSVLRPIISVITTVADILSGVLGPAISTVTGILQPFFDLLSGIMGFVGDLLGGALNGITSIFGGLFGGGSSSDSSDEDSGDTSVSVPGLASGGYVRANKPTTVVVGDNRVEGEIISPISMMKNTMLDALSTFAYASHPVQAAGTMMQETNNRTITQNVNITNQFNGGTTQAQKEGAKAMKQSSNDATSEMARALAYTR